MDRLNTEILIIGENIFSILLAIKLRRAGKELLIITQNNTLVLTNPVFRYYKDSYADKHTSFLYEIRQFLTELNIYLKDDLVPFEALYSSGNTVKVLTVPTINNYYHTASQLRKGLFFLHIENMEYPFHIQQSNTIRIHRIRVGNRDRIYSIYEFIRLLKMDQDFFRDFISLIEGSEIKENELLVLPPLLGISKNDGIEDILKRQFKREIFEILVPNSTISSMRLYLQLKEIQSKEKIKTIQTKIKGFERRDKIISKVITDTCEIYPQRVVLATGRFVEEGLTVNENKIIEPLFDLPVFFESSSNRIEYFTSNDIFEIQPFMKCGIGVNREFHPVNESGELVFENLYSCGDILLNSYDPVSALFNSFNLAHLIIRGDG